MQKLVGDGNIMQMLQNSGAKEDQLAFVNKFK